MVWTAGYPESLFTTRARASTEAYSEPATQSQLVKASVPDPGIDQRGIKDAAVFSGEPHAYRATETDVDSAADLNDRMDAMRVAREEWVKALLHGSSEHLREGHYSWPVVHVSDPDEVGERVVMDFSEPNDAIGMKPGADERGAVPAQLRRDR